ncbi:MAG: FAD-binding oxidoreductase [Lachnospiraceae bacterium]|nr:FAD-binding oxidoreductase [Lachnospiraceae bacterium]
MATYNQVTPEIIEQLKAAAPGHVFVGEDINPDYMRDEMPIYGKKMPDVLIQPLTTEEISAVMKICNDNLIPVTPRGAGTGLVGASVAVLGGVMIDTQKMNQILEYDLENMIVRVQPGVLLNDLAEDCVRQGLLYPPDPGEKFACLGGNVSTNAGGMRAVKYGATRDYVRAMKVVLANGDVVDFGAQVSKTSTGYSLINLMIGAEGTLGVITELTLKIIPAPKSVISLVIPFIDLETAISTVPKIKMAQLDPQALEFMEREIVLSSERFIGKSTFPKELDGQEIGAYLLVTFDGTDEDQVMAKVEKACELVLEAGAVDVLVADTPTKIKDAWAARSGFLEAIEAETKLLDECDVVVPINKIAEFLTFSKAYGAECGLEIKSFGHAGDGNLHIYQCSNTLEEEEFKKRVDKYFDKLYKRATEIGGLVSGEHGIGRGKMEYMRRCLGDRTIDLMFGIKKVFDPNLILNPGKVCYPVEGVD